MTHSSCLRFLSLTLGVVGLLFLASCSDDETTAEHGHDHGGEAVEPIAIVATTTDVADLARRVGGEHVQITTLAGGEEDPHAIAVTPGMVKALADADLLVMVGKGLEEAWLPDLVATAENDRINEGGEGRFEAGDSLRSIEGDTGYRGTVHPEDNPHFLLDPIEGVKVAQRLRDALAERQPDVTADFDAGFASVRDELTTLLYGKTIADRLAAGEAELEAFAIAVEAGQENEVLADASSQMGGQIAAFRNLAASQDIEATPFVGDHDLWPFFARRYGLFVAGYMEPAPGIEPTTAHLQSLIDIMEERGVKAILAAPYFDPRHGRFLSNNTGATVVPMAHQTGALPGAEGYVDMIRLNGEQALNALRGDAQKDAA